MNSVLLRYLPLACLLLLLFSCKNEPSEAVLDTIDNAISEADTQNSKLFLKTRAAVETAGKPQWALDILAKSGEIYSLKNQVNFDATSGQIRQEDVRDYLGKLKTINTSLQGTEKQSQENTDHFES